MRTAGQPHSPKRMTNAHVWIRIYIAFMSFWIIPNEIPSVSSHIAKYPIPGIAILGCKTLPPSVEIFLEKSEGTSIVFVTLPLVPPVC